MERKTFQVPAIGCDGCVKTIETEVSQLPGVTQVLADLNSKMVTVEWDQPASWQNIEAKLVQIEYPPA